MTHPVPREGRPVALASTLLLLCLACARGADPKDDGKPDKPPPDAADLRYGPYERNVLDLWKAKGDGPRPLVIFFHGGGFLGGNKTNLDPTFLEECLRAGMSVATSNYRFSTQAPFPAPMTDGGRAVQYLRSRAAELGLDPRRFAACGDSAGAGITLWLGFHPDLADPASPDPILRESSRLQCLATVGGQCSYDPRFIRRVVGGRAWEHPALPQLFGITPAELDSPRAHAIYEASAPINFLTPDDPPAFLYYGEPDTHLPPGPNTGEKLEYPGFAKEIEGQQHPGTGIHHPAFGRALKAAMDKAGIACVVRLGAEYPGEAKPMNAAHREMAKFIAGTLLATREHKNTQEQTE